jgi:hypothetical protein
MKTLKNKKASQAGPLPVLCMLPGRRVLYWFGCRFSGVQIFMGSRVVLIRFYLPFVQTLNPQDRQAVLGRGAAPLTR